MLRFLIIFKKVNVSKIKFVSLRECLPSSWSECYRCCDAFSHWQGCSRPGSCTFSVLPLFASALWVVFCLQSVSSGDLLHRVVCQPSQWRCQLVSRPAAARKPVALSCSPRPGSSASSPSRSLAAHASSFPPAETSWFQCSASGQKHFDFKWDGKSWELGSLPNTTPLNLLKLILQTQIEMV